MIDEFWTTTSGERIAVSDMTEAHVRNALRMTIRLDRQRRAADEAFPFEDGEFDMWGRLGQDL